MRPVLSLILGLSLVGGAAAGAQEFQQWGDAQNGGSRTTSSGPTGQGGHFQEEVVREWNSQPQDVRQAGGGYGGYEIPTYGYASQNYGWPGHGLIAGGGEISLGYVNGDGGVGGVPWTGPMGGYYYPGGGWDRDWGRRGVGGWRGGAWSGGGSTGASASSSTTVQIR